MKNDNTIPRTLILCTLVYTHFLFIRISVCVYSVLQYLSQTEQNRNCRELYSFLYSFNTLVFNLVCDYIGLKNVINVYCFKISS